MNIQELKNWLRPSIQQPRYIANMVKAIFAPTIKTQQVIQEYWSTWNKTYHPEESCETCKNYRHTRNVCGNATCFYEPKNIDEKSANK